VANSVNVQVAIGNIRVATGNLIVDATGWCPRIRRNPLVAAGNTRADAALNSLLNNK
jgi:hypothetical protein